MKNFFLLTIIGIGLFTMSNAQVDGKGLGLRFGGLKGDNTEISYQHPLGDSNRLEADLGISSWGFGATGIYQWVWDLSELADGFNWYAGFGGTLGISESKIGLGIAGQVGIEYTFDIPLQLSLDFRPAVYFLPGISNSVDGICLAVRYKF